jgi:hypothetical protein
MTLSRRQFLGSAATIVTAGCLSTPTTETNQATPPGDPPEGAVRAEGDSLTVERAIDPSRATYYPSNGTVRYGGPDSENYTSYHTLPFEDWAYLKAASVAAAELDDFIDENLTDNERVSVGLYDDSDDLLSIDVSIIDGNGGDELAELDVTHSEIVSTVPRYIESTVHLQTETYTAVFSVYVQ